MPDLKLPALLKILWVCREFEQVKEGTGVPIGEV